MIDRAKERALTTMDYSKYDFHSDTKDYELILNKGLNEEVVKQISSVKNEPKWMLEYRLNALSVFNKLPMPKWGADLSAINFDEIIYYMKSSEANQNKWEDVPEYIKETFDKLGIPEAERKFLGGVGAQYDSEVVYHSIREDLEKQGVIFLGMDEGLKEYEEIVKEHFGTVVPSRDNKFAALNSAVWSGGSFVYVPPNVKVDLPLQAYFRINAQNMGQFERTLIIADKGAQIHYIEGCFTKGTPIVATDGIKPIEEVKKFDKVLTHTGKYKEVYHTQVRPFTGKLFEIEYFGDTSHKIEVTGEHPFLAIKRKKQEYKNTVWEPEWINASELEKSDYLAIPIERTTDSKEEMEFTVKVGKGRHGFKDEKLSVKTDKDFFRLIGYYLAEGSIVGGHYLHFTFNKNEIDLIIDTKDLLKTYFGKEAFQQHEYKNGISIILSSTRAARFFESQFGKGAAKKHIPSWVKFETPEKQKELVKGFWKGDGSFMLKQYSYGVKRMFRMNTISKTLAVQLRDILLRSDIFASINLQRRTGNRKTMYCLYVGGSFLPQFTQLIETDIANEVAVQRHKMWLLVKETHAKSYAQIGKKYAFVPIKRISFKEVVGLPVYNFSVQEDESYIANGISVHNCTAPKYSTNALHSAVVEVIAKEDATVRYTTIQNWSNNIYNLVTKRAHAHRNSKVIWVDGNLGCLTADSKIFLNNDVKEIKDVEVGDVVYSLTPEFAIQRQKIVGKKVNPPREIFEITTENHRSLKATSNHPFLVLQKIGKTTTISWKPLEQIKVSDKIAISGNIPDHGKACELPQIELNGKKQVTFPKHSFDELMWLLGFYIGDGYTDSTRIYFAVPETDKSHQKVKKLFKEIFSIDFEKQRGIVLRTSSTDLVNWIKKAGFSGNAREKRIPAWVFKLPVSQKLAFIEGYMDADGYMRKNHKNKSITSANKALLEDTKNLAISCGLNPTKISQWTRKEKLKLGKEVKEYTAYFLYFGEQIMQNPLYFVNVSKIEPKGKQVTYDIEIEGTHNFIANGIFVHNSRVTMKYPSIYLKGEGSKAEILSVALAAKGQHQDAGAKAVHLASNTTSTITSKSISKDGGRASYRGLLKVAKGCKNVKSNVVCDALLLDKDSRSDTYPTIEIDEPTAAITHEARVGKVGDEQIFYLMSRGLSEQEALTLIVMGFISPFTKALPMEYAIELNRLIEMEMEGCVG